MLPYIKGSKVIVPDKAAASTLINKGAFGAPLKGGGLELSLMEAAYLVESDRLEVKRSRNGKKTSHHEILVQGMDSSSRFLENYLVFRDIRNRGINIQGDGERTFLSYPRGQGPGKGKADSWIMVFREHDQITIEDLFSESKKREGMRMDLVAAVVDGDWDLTYYSIRMKKFTGPEVVKQSDRAFGKEGARLIPGGGFLAWDGLIARSAEDLCLGSDLNGTFFLSKEEAAFLSSEQVTDGPLKERVYADLRSRGFMVRTGFKYGTHFRIYTSGSIEEHSDLLVHCLEPNERISWETMARAIRLSHSVRKSMVFAFASSKDGLDYLELEWTRP